METKKVGLVLSGGGYRGVAHAGAIKAFEEFGIVPDAISGTSAGALAGAFYAAGYTPEEIVNVFKGVKIFGLNRYARNKPGWIDTDTFRNYLLSYFPSNDFKALGKKLFITTTDLVQGQVKVFNSGNLIDAVLASAAVPGVFSPVAIGDGLYADGGILNNFPIEPLKEYKTILGVSISSVGTIHASQFKHSYDVLNRAFLLRMHRNSMTKFSKCDVVINPTELAKYNLFNSNHLDEIFKIGYQHTFESLEKGAAELQHLAL